VVPLPVHRLRSLGQRLDRWTWLGYGQVLRSSIFVLAIEFESERFAKGRQRPFGGVGFGSLQGNIVYLARGIATTFT